MTNSSTTVAHRFASAFNNRDVGRVLGCFAPDARYRDLFYGTFAGHEQIRSLFERMYAEGDHHEWTMIRTFTTSMAVPPSAGRTLTFDGVSVFETRNGLCHSYREHFDRAAALLALGIRPAAVAGIVARRPTVNVFGPRLSMLHT